MAAYSGLTISVGDQTYGWDDVVTWNTSTTPSSTASLTFESLQEIVWPIWNSQTQTAANFTVTDNGTVTGDSIWTRWISTPNVTDTITLRDSAWRFWIDGPNTTFRQPIPVQYGRVEPAPIQYAPRPTPAEAKAAELKRKLLRVRKRRPALVRGKALLRSIVSEEQWKDYLAFGSIREAGELAIYELGAGWSGHIYEIGLDGEPTRKLCVHMGIGDGLTPWVAEDRIAAVLLALRADEAGTVKKACTHRWENHEKERVKARRGHKRRVA